MGRPPIGKIAMTGAERVRRYRLKPKPVTRSVTKRSAGDVEVRLRELAAKPTDELKVVVRASVDDRLKQEAEALLAAIGLTISDAFRLLLMSIARDKALPFDPIFPNPKPIQKREGDLSQIITPQMQHHAAARTYDHFGFSGYRAAIACLYARPEGASQIEANEVAIELGSPQRGYLNMLHQAKKWGHGVVAWHDPARGGKIYKLNFNPNHGAPRAIDPPPNWKEMNVPKTPRGIKPAQYRPRSAN